MSIVRYVNKKTGVVALYESTSHYDPETKQSRPVRKYLGIEDPETGELIPSSGKRGRKKDGEGSERKNKTNTTEYEELYKQKCKECDEKDALIIKLERQNKKLKADIQRIRDIAQDMLNADSLKDI